jgi:hypothetical protein
MPRRYVPSARIVNNCQPALLTIHYERHPGTAPGPPRPARGIAAPPPGGDRAASPQSVARVRRLPQLMIAKIPQLIRCLIYVKGEIFAIMSESPELTAEFNRPRIPG